VPSIARHDSLALFIVAVCLPLHDMIHLPFL
jgi:hypothetical protein